MTCVTSNDLLGICICLYTYGGSCPSHCTAEVEAAVSLRWHGLCEHWCRLPWLLCVVLLCEVVTRYECLLFQCGPKGMWANIQCCTLNRPQLAQVSSPEGGPYRGWSLQRGLYAHDCNLFIPEHWEKQCTGEQALPYFLKNSRCKLLCW